MQTNVKSHNLNTTADRGKCKENRKDGTKPIAMSRIFFDQAAKVTAGLPFSYFQFL